MGDRHDYVALEWVKGEIAETLKQARQALEAFVENPQDSTRMRFCQTYVHQVHGTLQMVEFFGAALLAEEMEHLAQALIDGRVANQGEALEVLMQAILQLPLYLDRIQSARRDLPMVVLPLLNDLRAARGEKLLSETSLFSPDLSSRTAALSAESLTRLRTAELPGLLRKLRQMLQVAQVGVIRNQDLPTHLGYMARVFARLETLCQDSPLESLWQIASGVVEGLANGSLSNGTSVRTLLRQVDRELKRLVEQGADGINQPAPNELTKNLLFYVAKASPDSPRNRALRERYGLDEALPDYQVVDEERARLAGPDRDAMRSVVGALCEELVRVKDSLDLFVRSDRVHTGDLEGLRGPLKQIADTLAVLGFAPLRTIINDQLEVVRALVQGQQPPSDALLMDVAGALLYVEATLTGMVGQKEGASEESHLPTTDVTQIHQLVIKEARSGLEQAKDAIIEFIASQWNHEHLARVPHLLTQVRGGLAMIPLPRAAELLNACNRYIQEQLLVRQAVPNWQSLDTLADAITSVEYYLERLSEDHASQGDLILDVAEDSLASLGYPLQAPVAAVEAATADREPAPLDDPLHEIDVLAVPESDAPGASEPAAGSHPVQAEYGEADDAGRQQPDQVDAQAPLAEADTLAELELQPWLQLEPADEAPPAAASDDWTPSAVQALHFAKDQPASDLASQADGERANVSHDDLLPELPVAPPAESVEPSEEDRLWTLEELSGDVDLVEVDAPARDLPPLALADEEPLERLDSASLEEVDGLHWSDAELAELQLPEVELPDRAEPLVESEVAAPPLSMADVMATPLQAINPPAREVPPSLLPPPADEEPVDEELREVFIEEAGEVLETIAEFLPRWLADGEDREALREIRRAFHTLKGSGRMVRALVIGELAWSIENLLNRVLDGSIEASDDVRRVIREVVELMPGLVEEFAAQAQRQRDDVDHLAAAAHALAKGQPLPKPEAPAAVAAGTVGAGEAAAVVSPASAGLDPQLLEIFRNEALTHLQTLGDFLAECAQQLPRPVTDDLQRALHTLKGSAYMAGILPMAEIAAPLEKMVKEFKANLLAMEQDEADILAEARDLFRAGLEQLHSAPLAPLAGTEAFLERVRHLHERRLASVERLRGEAPGEHGRDPQLLSIFLAEGMDILFDAEDLLRRWREHPAQRQELSALLDELTTLGRGADMAELPQIDELCEALLDLYGAVEEGSLAVNEGFFDEAGLAHEALIGMMDQVAAGLQVSACPERVAALRALLGEALDPGALALLPAAGQQAPVVPLEQATQALAPLDEAPLDESMDGQLVAIFLEEAVDILDSAGQALQRWLAEPDNRSPLSGLQRDLHTLKGGANMAGIEPVSGLAHELEALYEGLIDRRYSLSPTLVDVLQAGHDSLARMLESLHRQCLPRPADELVRQIQALRQRAGQEWQDEALAAADPAQDRPLPAVTVVDEGRDAELVAIFLEEGFDIIDSAAAALARWSEDPDNGLELEALQRDLHTLKGGARMAEVGEIGDLAHELEFLYEDLGNGRLRPDATLFALLQACHDRLADMLEAVRAPQAIPPGADLIARIRHLRSDPQQRASLPSAVTLKASDQAFEAEADILEIFLEEADDLLEAMEAGIGRWEARRDEGAALDDLLRVLHTLKGGARLAGQRQLGDLSHDLEQHLSDAQAQGAPWPESLYLDVQSGFEALQRSVDELRERLQLPVPSTPAPLPEIPAGDSLPARVGQPPHSGGESRVLPFVRRAQVAADQAAARRAPQELVKVPAELLEGLVNLAGETSIFRGRVEQQVSDFSFTLSEMEATIDRVRDQLRRLDTETQAQILSRYQAEAERAGYEEFDPLEMDRHSQLQQLSRALFESASDLLDLKETLASRNRDAETLLLQQARVNTELQEGLMRTRMVPFDRLVPRLRRIVRQVASELGKQVEFIVGNAEGEMDRSVLERIVAPLEHMLRNAVDHGIEAGTVRRDLGKPEQGRIRLNLTREGGDIVLALSDDGAGINLQAVRRKAIERGLMAADAGLDEQEVLQFILEAGFSTAEKVTQISGRGVGMDVVNAEVKQLGGAMSIDSQLGQGTTFRIRLPFTVSVNRALMVLSGEDLYAIPLNTIEGIVRVSPYELESYYAPDAPPFEYAGQRYELRYLGDLLNNGQHPKLVGQSLPLPVILVRSSEHAVAVQVDSLAGSREIVVKSLGPQFAGVHGISGATILGDGRVVVILDLLATIRELHGQQRQSLRPRLAAEAGPGLEVEVERPTLVMVVDDSVTVRKVTSRLLERNGMNVVTAKDGVDAIAQLQEQRPDIMLLDIEMPRMDGFEVANLVRHDPGLKDLPIIMITSRTGEKHRERAMSIGVNEYLGKPYQESQLLGAIEQWAKRS